MSHHSSHSHRSSRAHHHHRGSGHQHPESHPLQPLPSGTMPSSLPTSSQSAPNLHHGVPQPHANAPYQHAGTYPYAWVGYTQAGASYPQAGASYPQAGAAHSHSSAQSSSTGHHAQGYPQPLQHWSPPGGTPASSVLSAASSHSTSVQRHASEAHRRHEGSVKPVTDRLTASGVPQLLSPYFQDTSLPQAKRESAEIVRQVLCGLVKRVMGEDYNMSLDIVTNIESFPPVTKTYKPYRNNAVTENILRWLKWLLQLGEVDKDANDVMHGLKHLATLSLMAQNPGAGATVNPLGNPNIAFAVRPQDVHDFTSALTGIAMLKMNEVAADIRANTQGSDTDSGLSTIIFLEDVIRERRGDLEGLNEIEENLEALCSKLKEAVQRCMSSLERLDSDFYASARKREQIWAWIYKHIQSIILLISASVVTLGTYTEFLKSLNATGAVAAVVTIYALLMGTVTWVKGRVEQSSSTPQVVADMSETANKLQSGGTLYLLANKEYVEAVQIFLRAWRGEEITHDKLVRIALSLNCYTKYVRAIQRHRIS
ncbi:hypothetical protein EV714DRAFT_268754 [Schizophyllum commune]